jgi:alanine dehydrogenase
MCSGKSISIVKERRIGENRVLLFPKEVKLLIESGYDVFIEQDAGVGSGVSNEDYISTGAKIVNRERAWTCSHMVAKLKGPVEEEYRYFHKKQHLCAFFHLEDSPKLADELCRAGVTAYSYELLKVDQSIFPISIPQSEISGKLAVIYGAYHLQQHLGGLGILLVDTIGVPKPKVVVIGYGNSGGAAIKTSLCLGLEVVVIGTNREKLRRFRTMLPSNVKCYLNTPEVIEREIMEADLVIGTILISTYDTPSIISEDLVKKMKKGSMIIDVTCGYGSGYLATFDKLTYHKSPTYVKHGVLHCKIDSLPASVPVTASQALSFQIAPYLIHIGDCIYGYEREDTTLFSSKIVSDGIILSDIVNNNHKLIKELQKKQQKSL